MALNDHPEAARFLDSMAKHGEREAGERFAAEHPLSKSAGAMKEFAWAQSLCAFLTENYDAETVKAIRMDCTCGPHEEGGRLKKLYAESGDPADFVERVNRLDLGFSLEYDGASYFIEYPQCYCPCVNRTGEPLSRAWCFCTLGYNSRMFESITGRAVQAELLSGVKLGDPVCRIRITVQPE